VVLTREGYVWTWGQPWPPGDMYYPNFLSFMDTTFAFSCLLLVYMVFPVYRRKQISVPVRVQGLENVRLIAVGAFHNLALKEDGTLWAWGNNEYGQLGTGDTQPRSYPIPVEGLDDLTLVCSLRLLV